MCIYLLNVAYVSYIIKRIWYGQLGGVYIHLFRMYVYALHLSVVYARVYVYGLRLSVLNKESLLTYLLT